MISAVIITHNEERNIGRCLASLAGIADEILVLDGHSTDRTVEICKAHGARVIAQDWLGYAATKNLGNDLAQYSYILSMDADEAISPVLRASLLSVKGELRGAYSFNRQAFYCGKPIRHGGWYPDVKLRLFPKGQAKWVGKYVHEELRPDAGLSLHHLPGDLLHYTYYSVSEHRARAKRYAALAAEKLRKKGKIGLLVRAFISPHWRFFQMFVLRLGLLDGWRGWCIASITATEVWWKYWWAATRKS
ncbi:MAG TPA: glycosyltransferase family 2 protein [Bacteroidia bacterium]|nr:glycosyltransferase family 2 protein [Bacteroidia bacterium]